MRRLLPAAAILHLAFALAGCSKSQSESCRKLVVCTEKLVPGTGASMEASYGKDGPCWKTPEAAHACAKACEQAMEGLKANPQFAASAECK